MKCIIDVVYNHTAPDSVLAKEHPEWFYHKADGSFGNKIGDWSDIIDLDYTQRGLWDYQIETLKQWAKIVDGFRCDVAPLVPLDFWLRARKEVAAVHPECIWLSESVEPAFVYENRKHEEVKQKVTSSSSKRIFSPFSSSRKELTPKHSGKYIAKLYIEGTIEDSNSSYNQKWLLDTIDDLKTDSDNVGIILFLNTPGGGVYEADEAYLALLDYKSTGKPLFAYMDFARPTLLPFCLKKFAGSPLRLRRNPPLSPSG